MRKFLKFSLVLILITGWLFSGWPRIWPLGGFDGFNKLTAGKLTTGKLRVNKMRIPLVG